MFAHVVGAKSASWRSGVCDAIRPYCKLPTFQIRPHSKFAPISNSPCYNSPSFPIVSMLQFAPIPNSPMLQFALCCCVCFPSNRPHSKLPPLQIALCCCVCFPSNRQHYKFAHVFNCPHVEGLIAISPYTGVIRTFANIRVNTQKSITGMVWVLLRAL